MVLTGGSLELYVRISDGFRSVFGKRRTRVDIFLCTSKQLHTHTDLNGDGDRRVKIQKIWLWWKRSLLEGFLVSVSFWTHTCVTPILYAFFSSVVGPSLAYISGVCFLLYKFYFSHVLTLFALVVRSYLNILQVQINLLPACFLWFLMVLRISVRQHILSGLTISIQLVQQTCHSSLPWPSEYHFQILLVHRPESYE